MSTPKLDEYLAEVNRVLKAKDGSRLRELLPIEPPLPQQWNTMIDETRRAYPTDLEKRLEKKFETTLPEYDFFSDGQNATGAWGAFHAFLVQYFAFLRDVNPENLIETHDMIKSLLSNCVLALSDAVMGVVVLPSVIRLSQTLAKLSIGLEKHPELLAEMTRRSSLTRGASETQERVTLVESSANTIREAFSKCLSERAGNVQTGLSAAGKPEGRRVGIYQCANLCLRLFFHCHKLRSAEQIFGNIYQQSPPLEVYPAAQRVTFLYYLGRYHFANNHFSRAIKALQAAYDQCWVQVPLQRRRILIPLIAANICLGRFPSRDLLSRPEAQGLAEAFIPLCNAIRLGDLATFHNLTNLENQSGTWMLKYRILLQIKNRCEVIVWRSLARRAFMLGGFKGGEEGGTARRAPTLNLWEVRALIEALEMHASRPLQKAEYMDPDLEGAGEDSDIFEEEDDMQSDSAQERNGRPTQFDGVADQDDQMQTRQGVSIAEVEAGIASLVRQGLLKGYMSHKFRKFVITGAKGKSALEVGFPTVWPLLSARAANEEVPGWVHDGKGGLSARARMGGQVIRRSNVTPVGLG